MITFLYIFLYLIGAYISYRIIYKWARRDGELRFPLLYQTDRKAVEETDRVFAIGEAIFWPVSLILLFFLLKRK